MLKSIIGKSHITNYPVPKNHPCKKDILIHLIKESMKAKNLKDATQLTSDDYGSILKKFCLETNNYTVYKESTTYTNSSYGKTLKDQVNELKLSLGIQSADLPTGIDTIIGEWANPICYPSDINLPKQLLPKDFECLNPQKAYLLFIDRKAKVFDIQNRTFRPNMFDDDTWENVKGNYLKACFHGYNKLSEKLQIKSIGEFTISDLHEIVTILTEDKDVLGTREILSNGYMSNPMRGIAGYYGDLRERSIVINLRLSNNVYKTMYNKVHILNTKCFDDDKYIKSLYENEQEIDQYFNTYKELYIRNLQNATGDHEKEAAILLFISQIECSHFFINGNTRLCTQLLLNKLLINNRLKPCMLFMPNGIAPFTLSHLNTFMEKNDNIQIPDIATLTQAIKEPLKWLHEGQDFYDKCSFRLKSSIEIINRAPV